MFLLLLLLLVCVVLFSVLVVCSTGQVMQFQGQNMSQIEDSKCSPDVPI